MLARVDAIDADIAALDARIEEMIAPSRRRRRSGWMRSPASAATAAARHPGRDRHRHDAGSPPPGTWSPGPSSPPGVKESAGKKKGKGSTGHGNSYLARVLGNAAVGRRADRHLPGRAVPAHRPPPRQQESRRRHRPVHPGHHLAPARPTPTPATPTSAATSTPPASTPNAASAATSASSKPSATKSPSNPPPEPLPHPAAPADAPPGAAARPLTLRFSDQLCVGTGDLYNQGLRHADSGQHPARARLVC